MTGASSHGSTYFLRTERLGFRSWSENDLPLAVDLWGDPGVTRLIDARGALSIDDVRQRLAVEIATERDHGIQYWPIFLLASGEFVGCCGLRPRDPAARIFELGVHIRRSLWRRGFAEEAARAVIDHAFSAHRATGLFAGHNPNNHASQRLLTKLGFRHTHDEFYPPTGLQHPSYILEPTGLCGSCRHARRIRSARESLFIRCGLSDTDPRFARYPRLPVVECSGFAEGASPNQRIET